LPRHPTKRNSLAINLARLFAYTRAVEDRALGLKKQLEDGVAEERTRHEGEMKRLKAAFSEERETLREQVRQLTSQVEAERKERGYLNDRLCQKLGLAPIHEASPGEAALKQERANDSKIVRGGPRATAIAAGSEAFKRQKEAVDTEVAQFVKDQGSQQQHPPANDGSSGNSDNR